MCEHTDSDPPRYICRSCAYEGDEYALVPTTNVATGSDGTQHDTAVCPECHGNLRLWVATR